MKYTLDNFNGLDKVEAKEALLTCCGSNTWADAVIGKMPFNREVDLLTAAQDAWFGVCRKDDHLEAYSHHPKIGDKENLREKFASTEQWASDEQSGMQRADEDTIDLLAVNNEKYFDEHGYVFLVCATGKSAQEMSALLEQRLKHSKEEELEIAKGEQHKITLLRLQKLIALERNDWTQVSQITTHVLDTSKGVPGKNIPIRLKQKVDGGFATKAMGVTNDDGRVANLLPPGVELEPGHYQMCFDTAVYFSSQNLQGFYPEVTIDFWTFDKTHYHVPLLINPFGYSTYRGS